MKKLKSRYYPLLRQQSSQTANCVKLRNLINILQGVNNTFSPGMSVLTKKKGALPNANSNAMSLEVVIVRVPGNDIQAATLESITETTIELHVTNPVISKIVRIICEIKMTPLDHGHDDEKVVIVIKALESLAPKTDAQIPELRGSSMV